MGAAVARLVHPGHLDLPRGRGRIAESALGVTRWIDLMQFNALETLADLPIWIVISQGVFQ
jgi:hypothetical protein